MTRYVGVDLHRRRSVIVVLDGDGTALWTHRIDNSPLNLGLEIEKAGPAPEVVLEATWGWYWAADVITEAGGRVHLAHPLGIAGYENRRVKNDQEDARLLADLLRMGRLPEAWIPPESVRHQRELVRYRRKLSQLRAGLKSQIHAIPGKEGLLPPLNHLWGPGGAQWLDETDMADAYETRVRSLRRLIKLYDTELANDRTPSLTQTTRSGMPIWASMPPAGGCSGNARWCPPVRAARGRRGFRASPSIRG